MLSGEPVRFSLQYQDLSNQYVNKSDLHISADMKSSSSQQRQPAGRAQKLFEEVSKMPRQQQEKIADVITAHGRAIPS